MAAIIVSLKLKTRTFYLDPYLSSLIVKKFLMSYVVIN